MDDVEHLLLAHPELVARILSGDAVLLGLDTYVDAVVTRDHE